MQLSIDPTAVVGAMLASVRIIAFLMLAPPFGGSLLPARVRVGLAVALSLIVAPGFKAPSDILEPSRLIMATGYQVLVGVAMGFAVMIVFSAVQAAGEHVDFNAGFTAGAVFDPTTNSGLPPMSRFFHLLAMTLLFSSGGHLLLIGGVLRSFEAAPLSGLRIDQLGNLLTANVGGLLVASIQIALPLVAALFVAELLMGFMSKAAPQMNLLAVGFGVKSLMVFALAGLSVGMLPLVVGRLASMMVRSMGAVAG